MAKVSMRMCIACRGSEPQRSLMRLVLKPCTDLACHCGRRAPAPVERRIIGRSAYVHERLACVRGLAEMRRLEHAFKVERGRICDRGVQTLLGQLVSSLITEADVGTRESVGWYSANDRRNGKKV